MPTFPVVDLTIEDFAGLLDDDVEEGEIRSSPLRPSPVQQTGEALIPSPPRPNPNNGQDNSGTQSQLSPKPEYLQGKKPNVFTPKPGFTPINRPRANDSLLARFRSTTNVPPPDLPSYSSSMSTSPRPKPVESLSAFDFNAPMEPVLAPNAPAHASSMLIPPRPKTAKLWPIFDSFNAKMKPMVQKQQWPVFNYIATMKPVSREQQQPAFDFNAPMNPVTREWQQPVFGFHPPPVSAVQDQQHHLPPVPMVQDKQQHPPPVPTVQVKQQQPTLGLNGPMKPVLRDQQQPNLDLNAPKEPVLQGQQQPAYIYNPPPPPPPPARGPVLPEVVSDDKEGCYLVKDKDWIYSSTIRIRPPVSALEFANDLSRPRGVGDTNNRFVVFTDGSAGRNNTATSAAIAYQRPLPSDDSPLWVARGFGIMGYAGGSNFAEFAAVSIALEAAVDMWNNLVTKENQLGPGAHPGPVPSWIKKLTPSPPTGRPKPRPPLPFSFIDLTGDDDHAVEVIDLTGDVSDNSDGLIIEIPPLVPPIVDKDRSAKPFQELHILTDAQNVLLFFMSDLSSFDSATWSIMAARMRCLMKQLSERGVVVHFHWVPGHSGAEGNERADRVCSIVRDWLIGSSTPPEQRVWEIEGLSERFARGPGFGSKSSLASRLSYFETKQRKMIKRWDWKSKQRRTALGLKKSRRERQRQAQKAASNGLPREATQEEKGAGKVDRLLRRSARIAANLKSLAGGARPVTVFEIVD